jgi:hypothetical protein
MAVRRLHRLVIHKPGIKLAVMLPMSRQAIDDIPIEAIAPMLYQSIQRDFERAPKRRSRGPYVLGPLSEPQKRTQAFEPRPGELWPRNMAAYIASADVLRG